jgi:uncharacterized protein with ParB-like and HNH nuclease domain
VANLAAHDVQIEKVDLRQLKSAHEGNDPKFSLTIPRYQRGIVWTEKQKEKLLDSISLGYPVGSLLAFQTTKKNPISNAPLVWQLVDGLQRTSTLIAYIENPFSIAGMSSFLEESDLKNLAAKLYPHVSNVNQDKIYESLETWLKSVKKPEVASGYVSSKLVSHLRSTLSDSEILANDANALEIAEYLDVEILEKIKVKVELIASSQLPIIVYTGKEENVPEIFERINSQGIKLSKYETFAATWTDFGAIISNQEIKERIKSKYARLQEAGYNIAGISNIDQDLDSFNLFEYLFGLGKVLAEKFDLLFPESGEDDELVSIAFVITTIAYKLKISQMSTLASALKTHNNGGDIDLSAFEKALFVACSDVQKKLSKYLTIKLNATGASKRFMPHSENQIYSLIVRYLIEKYDPEHNWTLRANSNSAALLENIPYYYLLDVLNGEWAGSGDTRLWNTCWIQDTDDSYKLAGQYLVKPTKQAWLDALNNWHNKELAKLQTKRVNITNDARLLMKYLYSDIVTVADDADLTFHIEHLWSVKGLTDLIEASATKEGWPISAMGNLALLTNSINSEKSDKMLGDFKSTNPATVTAAQWKRVQEWVISPNIDELKYRDDFTKQEFIDFCSGRFAIIRDQLLKNLGY